MNVESAKVRLVNPPLEPTSPHTCDPNLVLQAEDDCRADKLRPINIILVSSIEVAAPLAFYCVCGLPLGWLWLTNFCCPRTELFCLANFFFKIKMKLYNMAGWQFLSRKSLKLQHPCLWKSQQPTVFSLCLYIYGRFWSNICCPKFELFSDRPFKGPDICLKVT